MVRPRDWAAAAKLNYAIRKRIETVLEVDSGVPPDALLLHHLKALPHYTAKRLAEDPHAVAELKQVIAHGGKLPKSRGRAAEEAAEMKRQWFAMTDAIAERGTAQAAGSELLAMADRITGMNLEEDSLTDSVIGKRRR
jgi:hypothetical protein